MAMRKYIYDQLGYPDFRWDKDVVLDLLISVSKQQGKVLGKMQQFGFGIQQEAMLNALTQEIVKSSEIEGEILNSEQVRSSLAKHLNIEIDKVVFPSHHIDGVVETMMDATKKYAEPLTQERLFGWHASLFPTGYSGMHKIRVADYRDDDMQVVANKNGREIIYYEAPPANLVSKQMNQFLDWFNESENENFLLKSAIAHLWFVIIHPFDDGNGRLARTITEMALARAENTSLRFYSLSAQIQKEKKDYYSILERTSSGDLDITPWIKWFFECLIRAIDNADEVVGVVLKKADFWQRNSEGVFSPLQRRILNLLLDGFIGNLTSGKVEKICKISQDTATRALKDLVNKGHLEVRGNGRSTHYVLKV